MSKLPALSSEQIISALRSSWTFSEQAVRAVSMRLFHTGWTDTNRAAQNEIK